MDARSVNGTTVVGGPVGLELDFDAPAKGKDKEKSFAPAPVPSISRAPINYIDEQHRFFVPIGAGGLLAALSKLDEQLRESGRTTILSKKNPIDWIGKEIHPGQLGLYSHGALPKLITKPGRYPGAPLRNWWARSWRSPHFCGISDTVISYEGLTVVQVSQNQAAVISDPQNRIFVVRNGGFAAMATEGSYDVLDVVDQTHLPNVLKDRMTGAILGSTLEVAMQSTTGQGASQRYVVALFLNIPANNCAIIQRAGDQLELLQGGQHCITDPSATLRGLYSMGESQLEMPTKDIFTRDQVPVSLTIYLKWQLLEPLKLATHGYNTPYDALRDKTQSILTQIMSHLDYSSMVKQRTIAPGMDDGTEASSAFLDALRTRAMDEMHEAALEYGIELRDLAVIDRQFKGEIATTMDRLTTRALQAQVEASNVDRENSNRTKQEEGKLAVARIQAQSQNTAADAQAYSIVAAARAAAQALKIKAEAEADATRIAAMAEAEAIAVKARADTAVVDVFAREMQLRRVEVARVAAFGDKTVFVPSTDAAAQAGSAMIAGLAAGMGAGGRQ